MSATDPSDRPGPDGPPEAAGRPEPDEARPPEAGGPAGGAAADDPTAPGDAAEPGRGDGTGPTGPPAGGWRRWMPRRRPPAGPSGGGEADAPADADAADAGEPPAEGGRRARWRVRRRARPPVSATADPSAAADAAAPPPGDTAGGEPPAVDAAEAEGNPGRLRRRRRRLIDEREVAVYHLGGLAFELYRRDLLSEEVLKLRAGRIALIDETVHDIDLRLEHMDAERRRRRAERRGGGGPAVAGNCMTCRAPFHADARFCYRCGARLAPADDDADRQVTQAITGRPT